MQRHAPPPPRLRRSHRSTVAACIATILAMTAPGASANRDVSAPGAYTVAARLAQFRPEVEARLRDMFEEDGLQWPPREVALLAFKDRRRLEVHARMSADEPWRLVTAYPVLGASGTLGPKLREGDRQVPEGVYRVQSLNPNSRYHLALRLDYPNAFDRAMAARDGRRRLGGDIMIHGDDFSVGCLAVGDAAARDLFVLAALVTPRNMRVVISPTDLRALPAGGAPGEAPADPPDDTAAAPAEPSLALELDDADEPDAAETTGLEAGDDDESPLVLPPTAPPWTARLYESLREVLLEFPSADGDPGTTRR